MYQASRRPAQSSKAVHADSALQRSNLLQYVSTSMQAAGHLPPARQLLHFATVTAALFVQTAKTAKKTACRWHLQLDAPQIQ
jgi:hypothetical protein